MFIDRHELLYAIRSARRAPLLSLVAVAALTLGIGLNAGVFTLLNAMFLTSPTRKDAGRFVQVYPRYEGWFTGAGQFSTFTTEDYDAIRKQAHTLEDATAWQVSSAILNQGPRRIGTVLVDCNYFHVFGFDRPETGRFFERNECNRGTTAQIAVLSEVFWKYQFGADPKIVGKTVHLNGLPLEIVGIVPSDPAHFLPAGVFVPYTVQPLLDRNNHLLASP